LGDCPILIVECPMYFATAVRLKFTTPAEHAMVKETHYRPLLQIRTVSIQAEYRSVQ